MLISQKGQAALEYLMTYSWALVAIAIVIGVLIFMGILKAPSAGTCTGLDKLAYEDHTIDSNGNFILYLKNGAGMQISISSVLPGEDFGGSCSASSAIINATKDFNIVCTNTGISAGQAYKGKITIEYMRRSAKHTESATCSGTAPLTGIFLLASAPQIIEGFFAGGSSNLDLNNPDEMMLEMGGGSYASFGSYTSNIFDANSTMDWTASISWDENTPVGTDINLQTRTSDNNILWSAWSGYYTNASGQAITSPNGRFIQYKANLSTTNPALTPRLLEVRMHGNPLAQSCGNLKREGTEQCDTNDLAGQNCILLGYSSGTLACSGACTFDTNGCIGATTTMLCPGSKTWTSQSDWQSGALANIDSTSSQGSIKLALPSVSGTWNIVVDSNAAPTDWNAISWGGDLNYGGELSADANTRLLLHFNEGSGATASDASGNGNNGTISGASWTASGKFGSALQFDGVNDQVNIASSPSIEFGDQSFTFMAWFKTSASGINTIITNYHVDAEAIFLRTDYQGDNRLEGTSRDSADVSIVLRSPNAVNDGNWHFAAYVRDTAANIVRLYLDGVDVNSSTDTRTGDFIDEVGNNAYEIGSKNDGDFFNGAIDEVAIYNRALGAGEILEHYKRGALNLRLRTRSAASQGALGSASWSQYYTGTPSAIASPDNKWIEVQALLETENAAYTPVLNDVSISCAGAQGNLSPFAGLGASAYSADVGTYITLYGNTSYDSDGNIVNYAWNFGDGNVVSSGASIMHHKYSLVGDYNVALTVTDNNSATDANTVSVNITPGPISFCPGTKTWTTQGDWQSGSDVNIDSASSPGSIKLSPPSASGTWNATFDSNSVASDWNIIKWGEDLNYGGELSADMNLVGLWQMDNQQYDDNFDGAIFDANKWTALPAEWSQSAGKLNVAGKSSEGAIFIHPDNNAPMFAGDFDIQIDIDSRSISGGTASIEFMAHNAAGTELVEVFYDNGLMDAGRIRTGGTYYTATVSPQTTGKWRIRRVGSTGYTYHWKNGAWEQIYSHSVSTEAFYLTIFVWVGGSGRTVSGVFDNFRIVDAEPLLDSSSRGNNGTINGATWTSSGKFGNALTFDGADDYVNLTSTSGFPTGAGQRTVAAWFKTGSAAEQEIFIYGTNALYQAFYIAINTTTDCTGNITSTGGNYALLSGIWGAGNVCDNVAISDGNWHHVVSSYDGTNIMLYVDGVLKSTGNPPGTENTVISYANIGRYSSAAYFNGSIDEVGIWNRALGASEILALYQRTSAYYSPSPRLIMHIGEGAGSVTADSSGNGNNGTINGSAAWTSNCRFGNCLVFDGVNDYVSMADSPSLYLGSGNFTMGVWAKFSSTAGAQVFLGQNPSASRQFTLLWRTSDGKLVFSYSTNGTTPIEATYSWSPTTNVWYYIALVRNGSDLNAYVNGAQIGSTYNIGSATLYNSTASFYIGENVTDGGYFFNGTMDEIVISGDALNANEILNNYKQGIANIRARTRTAASQLALSTAEWSNENELDANADINGLWHFNEGSGATANDSSGNGNNGTLVNGPTWTSSGKFGNALQFDGVNDYVNIIKSDEFHFGANSFAVAAWVNFAALSGVQNVLAFYVVTNNALQFAWNTDHFTIWGETSTVLDTTGFSPALNTWYHVAFVRNGNAWNIYVNGTSYANAVDARTLNYPKDNVGIGLLPTSLQYFNGKIDELAIYNRALSVNEVLGLYKRSKYYTSSHSTITSDSNRFIEVQALLETENAAYTPVLNDLNISCS